MKEWENEFKTDKLCPDINDTNYKNAMDTINQLFLLIPYESIPYKQNFLIEEYFPIRNIEINHYTQRIIDEHPVEPSELPWWEEESPQLQLIYLWHGIDGLPLYRNEGESFEQIEPVPWPVYNERIQSNSFNIEDYYINKQEFKSFLLNKSLPLPSFWFPDSVDLLVEESDPEEYTPTKESETEKTRPLAKKHNLTPIKAENIRIAILYDDEKFTYPSISEFFLNKKYEDLNEASSILRPRKSQGAKLRKQLGE